MIFAKRVLDLQYEDKPEKDKKKVPPTAALCLFNVIAHNIASQEVTTRVNSQADLSTFYFNTKAVKSLFQMINSGLSLTDHLESFRQGYLVHILNKIAPEILSSSAPEKKISQCVVCNNSTHLKCSKCKMVHYCSRECQVKDFPNHKKVCEDPLSTPISDTPVLATDIFGVFVRLVNLLPRKTMNLRDLFIAAQHLFPAVIAQALLSLILGRNHGGHGKDEIKSEKTEELCSYISKKLGIAWESNLNKQMIEEVKQLSLPFLRRVTLYILGCSLKSNVFEQFEELMDIQDEYESLTRFLKLSMPEEVISAWTNRQKLLIDEVFNHPDGIECFTKLAPPFQFRMIPLERDFHALLTRMRPEKCPQCGTTPKETGICLLCGKFLCINAACCTTKAGLTEAMEHAKECGRKIVILLVKQCTIFLLRRQETEKYISGCFYSSIYLDKYGEEDPGFNRGKPLFLDEGRYEQLRLLWMSSNFDDEVSKRDPRRYRV